MYLLNGSPLSLSKKLPPLIIFSGPATAPITELRLHSNPITELRLHSNPITEQVTHQRTPIIHIFFHPTRKQRFELYQDHHLSCGEEPRNCRSKIEWLGWPENAKKQVMHRHVSWSHSNVPHILVRNACVVFSTYWGKVRLRCTQHMSSCKY